MSSWPSFGCWWDLTTERLWDLQRDFVVLQDEMVTAYAMLGSLPAPVELQQCQEQPGEGNWGDQPSA